MLSIYDVSILSVLSHRYILRSQHLYTFPPTSALPVLMQAPCSGSWGQSGVRTGTVPCLTSPETLVHIPGVWWGCLNPDPRRQKTFQFGDYEEHNTQHSGFHISVQHSSLRCIRAGRTRGRDKRSVTSRPSELKHWICLAVPDGWHCYLDKGEGCLQSSGTKVLQPRLKLHESSTLIFLLL